MGPVGLAPRLPTRWLEDGVTRLGEVRAEDRMSIISAACTLLSSEGFQRVRFYELVSDLVAGAQRLVLVASTDDQFIGFQSSLAESTLSLLSSTDQAMDCDTQSLNRVTGGVLPAWHGVLGMSGRRWVEIPVSAGGVDVGVLAADWAETQPLSADSLGSLTALGTCLALLLQVQPSRDADRALRSISSSGFERADYGSSAHADLDETIGASLKTLGDSLNIAVTALFEFDWTTGKIRKRNEYIHESLQNAFTRPITEEYALNEHLTGRAWLSAEKRYTSSFRELEKHDSTLIAPESLRWHTRLTGEVQTVAYEFAVEGRFMLRLINRVDDIRLPLIAERDQFRRIAQEIGDAISSEMMRGRLQALRDLAIQVVRSAAAPREVFNSLRGLMSREGVRDFLLLAHTEGAERFAFSEYSYDPLRNFSTVDSWHAVDHYAVLYKSFVSEHSGSGTPRFVRPRPSTEGASTDLPAGAAGYLAFPASSGQTFGALLIPLSHDPLSGPQSLYLPAENMRQIATYSQLCVSTVAARSNHLTAEGARRVLGFIGHELSTPIALLGDLGVEAVSSAQLSLQSIQQTADTRAEFYRLEAMHDRLGEQRHQVAQLLSVAPLVAQESRGRLQVHFDSASLSHIVGRAIEQVQVQLSTQKRRTRIEITTNAAFRTLPDIVCDSALMTQVFVNLINNAVKYSLPPGKGEPALIRVLAEPQATMAGFLVENWGLGIPADEYEEIFQPFVRGGLEDTQKAIRGMGLGLFLSRRIMRAHRGDLFCRDSSPTLKDPRRLALMEGYKTIFELRLPYNLTPGTHTVALDISGSVR